MKFDLDVLACELRHDGVVVWLPHRHLALLLLLALQAQPQSAEDVARLLYPELARNEAMVEFTRAVEHTRWRLRDARVIIEKKSKYSLGNGVNVDLQSVETYVKRLILTGEPLNKTSRRTLRVVRARLIRRNRWISRQHKWLAPVNRRLQMLLCDVSIRLGQDAVANGEPAGAIYYAAESLNADSGDPRALELAIRAHQELRIFEHPPRQLRA
ncbi:MAG: hypothetical protein JO101_07980 [Candidatus Eremiobacteraeota bacterium]|nr:hypothetical protein [Candidatus Eremiobacteraeota bacterium]MBV8355241.1 hypothetical protein [Candidatus Eremiobacteraeota bacterium]